MSDDKNKEFTPKGEETIRQEVINEFKSMGYDPEIEDNKPLLDNLIKKELEKEKERIEYQKKLSKAIEQKRKYRQMLASDEEADDDEDNQKEPILNKPKGENNFNLSNEELIKLQNEIEAIKQHQVRQKYSHLTDEEFNYINAIAKVDNKSFDEVMEKNPIVSNYLKTINIKQRLNEVTLPPSGRTTNEPAKTEEQKIAEELSDDLPVGFKMNKDQK